MTSDQQPVTQQDLAESLNKIRLELRQEIAASEARIVENMRDMQSEILRGLDRFARGNFSRMHRLETSDSDVAERINALEERVLTLETRPLRP
jgi:hypothetical protein